MRRLPDLIVIVDAQYEDTAIKEARRLDIPTIATVDSNTDPKKVTFPIPANDDSMRTIQLIISAIADTIVESRGKSLNKEQELNNEIQAKDNSDKNNPTIQNTSQESDKSIPETSSDDSNGEEE